MLDAELVTDKYLSKEYIENLIKRYGWSFSLEQHDDYLELDLANSSGKYICWLDLNEIDENGNEIYCEELKLNDIEDELNNELFSNFKPHYNSISYFSDTGNELLEFFHMLKDDGVEVFYRFNYYNNFKKLE